jgi:hypothetical protein
MSPSSNDAVTMLTCWRQGRTASGVVMRGLAVGALSLLMFACGSSGSRTSGSAARGGRPEAPKFVAKSADEVILTLSDLPVGYESINAFSGFLGGASCLDGVVPTGSEDSSSASFSNSSSGQVFNEFVFASAKSEDEAAAQFRSLLDTSCRDSRQNVYHRNHSDDPRVRDITAVFPDIARTEISFPKPSVVRELVAYRVTGYTIPGRTRESGYRYAGCEEVLSRLGNAIVVVESCTDLSSQDSQLTAIATSMAVQKAAVSLGLTQSSPDEGGGD